MWRDAGKLWRTFLLGQKHFPFLVLLPRLPAAAAATRAAAPSAAHSSYL